jgi:NAD(P)-dependent dehydrogenase (short-subunit alcohol dehydrogenase family)
LKLKVAIADTNEEELKKVGKELAELTGESNVLIIPTDVSQLDQVVALKEKVYEDWGEVRYLRSFLGMQRRFQEDRGGTGSEWGRGRFSPYRGLTRRTYREGVKRPVRVTRRVMSIPLPAGDGGRLIASGYRL